MFLIQIICSCSLEYNHYNNEFTMNEAHVLHATCVLCYL